MTLHYNDGLGARCGASTGHLTVRAELVTCGECTGGVNVRRQHKAERCPGCDLPPGADAERVYVGPLRGDWHSDCLTRATTRGTLATEEAS